MEISYYKLFTLKSDFPPLCHYTPMFHFVEKQIYFAAGQWPLWRNFHCLSNGKCKYFTENWAKIYDVSKFTSDWDPHSEDQPFLELSHRGGSVTPLLRQKERKRETPSWESRPCFKAFIFRGKKVCEFR